MALNPKIFRELFFVLKKRESKQLSKDIGGIKNKLKKDPSVIFLCSLAKGMRDWQDVAYYEDKWLWLLKVLDSDQHISRGKRAFDVLDFFCKR